MEQSIFRPWSTQAETRIKAFVVTDQEFPEPKVTEKNYLSK